MFWYAFLSGKKEKLVHILHSGLPRSPKCVIWEVVHWLTESLLKKILFSAYAMCFIGGAYSFIIIIFPGRKLPTLMAFIYLKCILLMAISMLSKCPWFPKAVKGHVLCHMFSTGKKNQTILGGTVLKICVNNLNVHASSWCSNVKDLLEIKILTLQHFLLSTNAALISWIILLACRQDTVLDSSHLKIPRQPTDL